VALRIAVRGGRAHCSLRVSLRFSRRIHSASTSNPWRSAKVSWVCSAEPSWFSSASAIAGCSESSEEARLKRVRSRR
jgi:hypothetical protein